MWKKNDLRFGIVLGFISPLVCMIAYYFIRFYPIAVLQVLQWLGQEKNQITAFTVPSLLLNIVLFTFYVNTHRDETAKGLFASTLIYALAAILIKFLL